MTEATKNVQCSRPLPTLLVWGSAQEDVQNNSDTLMANVNLLRYPLRTYTLYITEYRAI
jgi:hypothetical protein